MFKKTCKGCGREFESLSRNTRFCSLCVKKRENLLRRQPPRYEWSSEALDDIEFFSYFMGFLFSDGCISGGNIWWGSTDQQIVEDISVRLKYTRLVSVNFKSRIKPIFYNRLLKRYSSVVVNYGYSTDKELRSLRELGGKFDLFPFLRGFMDGDGSLRVSLNRGKPKLEKVSFLGRRLLLEEIQEQLLREGFERDLHKEPLRGNRKRQLYSWSIAGKEGLNLLEKMYKDSTISLDRKRYLYELFNSTSP